MIIIAGNGAKQCIIINHFSLPGSISSYDFVLFSTPGASWRPKADHVFWYIIKIENPKIKSWSKMVGLRPPGGPRVGPQG